MAKPLHVLIVEDSENDAILVLRELKHAGFEPTHRRVDTADTLNAALDAGGWDVVVCDWSLPGLSALGVLSSVKQRGLDLPFLIVSGAIDEESAVDALRAGAHDFLHKGRLNQLGLAIERECREAKVRGERRKMQEQLLLSDRLTSLGTLAAGVAHEINNPLTAVLANLELVARALDTAKPGGRRDASEPPESAAALADRIRDCVDDAREAGERIRRIVRDLSVFLRSDDEGSGSVDVQHVLESALRISSSEIRQHAQLVKDYADVPPVHGSEARLVQVFVNLIVNAAQSMPDTEPNRHEIRIATRLDRGGWVRVEVADTGCGISQEHLSRIFDPFFTTKPVGVGTGLGLSVSHRIVAGLGGEIKVSTQLGKGTTFAVLLPVARPMSKSPNEALREAYSLPPSALRARVLVVDDEVAIVSAIRAMLSIAHDITVETNAESALQRIRSGERFDIILCDLMMPDISGMDLYETLAQEAPQQARRIVFITGGAFTYRARTFLDEVQNPRIDKPFTSQQLLGLIRSLVR